MMDWESGDHFALFGSVAMLVSLFALLVAPVAGSKSASQICWAALTPRHKQDALAIRRELRPASPGLPTANLNGTCDSGLGPAIAASKLRRFGCSGRRFTVVTE